MKLAKVFGSRASKFVGSGFVAGIAAAFAGSWFTTQLAAVVPEVTNGGPPLATVETLRQANDQNNVSDADLPSSLLDRLGVAVNAHFTVRGLRGRQQLKVTCAVYAADAPAGWWRSASWFFDATSGEQISPPCFVFLPASRRARNYNVIAAVQLVSQRGAAPTHQWSGGPAPLTASFVAPPTENAVARAAARGAR